MPAIVLGCLLLGLLVFPIGAAKANQVDIKHGESVYDRLVIEFEVEKAKMDKGEPVNKLELAFKGHALDAVDFTQQNFKKQLDFSEDSIKNVEECLDLLNKSREKFKPSDEQLFWTAKIYAGYIGQVIKLRWGVEWRAESEYSFENGPALKVGESHLFLLSKVYRRLTGGPEDNVWHFYQATKIDLGR